MTHPPPRSAGRGLPVIGIAGTIGAGKSLVASMFAELGCVVSDSDAEAKACLDQPDVQRTLAEWWGPSVLTPDTGPDGRPLARIDRRAVAARVFADEAERRRLEALIHPRLRVTREALIANAERRGAPAVILDAPLLFEAGLDAECDAVVFVDAPLTERRRRVRERRGWDAAELDRRELAQWPPERKRTLSDHVVVNESDPSHVRAAVALLLPVIRAAWLARRAKAPASLRPDSPPSNSPSNAPAPPA